MDAHTEVTLRNRIIMIIITAHYDTLPSGQVFAVSLYRRAMKCQLMAANAVTCCAHREPCPDSKTTPVTGRGGREMIRIPQCLHNRLTDGGKGVSHTHRPCSTPEKLSFFNVYGTHFC
jgi:hypothetical protein